MLQFHFLANEHFVHVQLEGLVSLDAWQQTLSALEKHADFPQGGRLVLDLRGLLGWLGIPEREGVGALMATHFARMRKVALVIQKEKIAGVVEAQARRLGLDLKLFSDFGEAQSWVVSD
ncbi:MAG: STAS/SEC14 domain-containing protein [Ramlibacter sp.]